MKNRINLGAVNRVLGLVGEGLDRTELLVMAGTPVTKENRDRAVLGDQYDEFVAVNTTLALQGEELAPEDFVAMTADRDAEFEPCPMQYASPKRRVDRVRPSRSAINRSLAAIGEMI